MSQWTEAWQFMSNGIYYPPGSGHDSTTDVRMCSDLILGVKLRELVHETGRKEERTIAASRSNPLRSSGEE